MDYNSLSKEQLIQVIEELQILNNQLLKEKEQEVGLDFSWAGNLGHWYWNIKTNAVTFNHLKITTLGYSEEEIPKKVGYEFFTEKLHPEDYEKTMDAMLAHLEGKSPVYEVEYRIKTKCGKYKWYYDRGKITKYDSEGKPIFLAGIVFDITESKEFEDKLKSKNKLLIDLAFTDELTRVKNHRYLMEYLKVEIIRTRNKNIPLSIAMFDVDYFKKVNDTMGHTYGDKVLTEVAQIMEDNIREKDVIGRYGGEEFMIIFTNTTKNVAQTIAEQIRVSVEKHYFGGNINITISGGVFQYCGQSLVDFIHLADMNLYKAKKLGRNKIV